MNTRTTRLFFLTLIFSTASTLVTAEAPIKTTGNEAKLAAEARAIVKQFGGQLKPKLKSAIQSGGLEHAVAVCSVEAPKIAATLSETSGWQVKRVSLKARNKTSASPDAFETKVLEDFDLRQQQGEQPPTISFVKVIDGKFRFMQAQGTEGLCLSCHGNAIPANVKKAISQHYPNDLASGYSLGQVRGAFSLTKDL